MLSRMKLAHRLWLAVAFPLVSLIFVSYQNYRQTVEHGLTPSLYQLRALPIIHDLRTLLERVQKQRGYISQTISETQVNKNLLQDNAASVLKLTQQIAGEVAAGSTAAEDWIKIQQKITAIFGDEKNTHLSSFDTYTEITEGILNEIDVVAYDSHFASGGDRAVEMHRLLADLVPHLAEEVSIVRGLVAFNLFVGETSSRDISKVAGYLSLSQYRFRSVMSILAGLSNVEHKAAFQKSYQAFTASIDDYLKSGAVAKDQDVLKLGAVALADTYSVFDEVAQQVGAEVAERVAEHKKSIRNDLIISILGFLLCSAFLFRVARSLVTSITGLLGVAEKIAAGDRNLTLAPGRGRDEMSTLTSAIERMYRAICQSETELRQESKRKELMASLNATLQGGDHAESLGDKYLRYLVDALKIGVGAVYLLDETGAELRAASAYAPTGSSVKETRLNAKHGLLGEALSGAHPLVVDGLSAANTTALATGMLRVVPAALVVAPVAFEGKALGVVEVGFVQQPDTEVLQLFQQTVATFAIRLNAALSRTALESLYERTRDQAKELEAVNADLEMKSQELEQQQTELEIINQKLEQQREDLQAAKDQVETKAAEVEKASRYKSEFLANMSHELRSPLNSVLIFAEVLATNNQGTLTDKEVEFARSIHSSGTDLLNLIEDILDLSKVEAGHLEIRPDRFDLAALIDTVETTFRPQIEKKGLLFVVDVHADVPATWTTDRQRVTQIVRNFLSNACKFTDQGSIIFRIEPRADQTVAMSVTDTGIGIKKEDQGRLFKAFQQIDAGVNRRFSGTGLGLSISLKLAQLLGGRVEMTSDFGKGSTFTAILPVALAAAAPTPLNVLPFPAERQAPKTVSAVQDDRATIGSDDRTILVIEDDAAFAQHVVDCCRAKGFKCIVAAVGENGLDDAAAFTPSGIILDVHLPGMNGLSVLDHLKRDPRTKRIPVHVVSANDYHIEVERHEHVGFLRKPVSQSQLQSLLDGFDDRTADHERRVLIVAKEGDERQSIVSLIEAQRASTRLVTSGSAALNLLGHEAFDCVVVDLDLPDTSGIDVLQQIKTQERLAAVPVIVLADHELTERQDQDVTRYAGSVIVKGEKAAERLLDEVSLFLHSVTTRLPPAARRVATATTLGSDALQGRKVLLVDDDMRNLFAVMSILEAQGMIVHTASNGREALQCLEREAGISLVLMDMMMPEMDGYEATREIRKIERFKKLPVIALTARAMKGEREQCLASGADDYMSKPLKVDQLLALIKLWTA